MLMHHRGISFLWLALLLVQPAAAQTLFTDVAEQVGLSIWSARNVVFTNYDNDDFLDMFLTENRFSPR